MKLSMPPRSVRSLSVWAVVRCTWAVDAVGRFAVPIIGESESSIEVYPLLVALAIRASLQKRQDPPERVESGEAGNHPAGTSRWLTTNLPESTT